MNKTKCINCAQYKNCRDSFKSWIFFVIGLIATFAVRLVSILMDYSEVYAKIAWYVGVLGFFVFFLYKFNIDQARSRLIAREGLVNKINEAGALREKDYALIQSILCSLNSAKDRINYFVIFSTSIITFALALYLDFFKR